MKQSNPLNPSNKPSKEKVYFPLPNRSGLLGCVVAWNDRPPTLQQLRFPAPPGHRIYISKFFKLTKALEGRSFPLLSHPCLPIGTSKNVVNVYIIATSGLLVRLQWCIRHDFDDILMFPTPCWWDFDVSDIFDSIFRSPATFFMKLIELLSTPAIGSTILNIATKHFN